MLSGTVSVLVSGSDSVPPSDSAPAPVSAPASVSLFGFVSASGFDSVPVSAPTLNFDEEADSVSD